MSHKIDFLINTWNHGTNPNSGADIFRYLCNGLSLAGMNSGVSPALFHNANLVNILVENFNIETAKNLVEAHHDSGVRFIIVATELLTGDSFNDIGSKISSPRYSNLEYWRERYDSFAMLAEVAEAIWLMCEYQKSGYERNFPNTPILTIPMCFDPIEATASASFTPPKLYEAMFMGTHTSIRTELMDELKNNVHLYTPNDVPAFMVGSVVKSAQICLHLHLKSGWPITSIMRQHVLLTHGAYIISEKSDHPGELDDFVEVVSRDSYVDAVRARILDKTIVSKAIEMQRQYAANGDMGEEFRRLLEATF